MSAATSLPPGPSYPRPVQTLGWVLRPRPFMERCQARYGDIFTMKIANEGTWVMVSDPDAVKQVFTGDPKVFHAGEGNRILKPVLGPHSVLLLDEQQHMAQRKLMLPSFHGERMQRYGDLMAEITERELERWPAGEPFPLWPRTQAITLEVIMRAVFGIRETEVLDRLRERLRTMLEWTTNRAQLLALAVLGPNRVEAAAAFRRALEPVDEVLYEEIARRRRDPGVADRDDILSLLAQARHEDGHPMSEAELRDELLTLLVAGHETTATALAWAFERLLRHPERHDRLREEVAAGEDAYLDAVIKETLRLRPVLGIVARRLTQPAEVGGYLLPAGVTVTPSIYLVHRRPEVYPEPRAFRPERFLEQPAGTYTWIPFGGGVRRCLGASFAIYEMKVVLCTIVSKARLRPARAASERVVRRAITLNPERGAEVVVEPAPTRVAA